MPTELVPLGIPFALIQGTVYALPACRCLMFSVGATFEQAANVIFAVPSAVVFTNGQAELAGGFIRCTAGPSLVTFKKA